MVSSPAVIDGRVTHGLYTDDLSKIPVEFKVDITPDLTIPVITEHLTAIANWGMEIHERLTAERDGKTANTTRRKIKGMGAAATFSNVASDANRLRAQIIGGSLRDVSYKDLPPEESDRLRREWARLQSGNLSVLNNAVEFAREFGIRDPEDDSILFWVEQSMPKMMNAAIANFRYWAQLLIWEGKKGLGSPKSAQYREGMRRLLRG